MFTQEAFLLTTNPITEIDWLLFRRMKTETLVNRYDIGVTLTPKIAPPLMRWSLMIGNIVHNVSSALDNVVWELMRVNPCPPPFPSSGSQRVRNNWLRHTKTIGFPYCKDASEWRQTVDRCLFFVEPSLATVFERAQPFYVGQNGGNSPEDHPLWILHELWNRDKHCSVNLATVAVGFRDSHAWLGDAPVGPELGTHVLSAPPSGPIEGKTYLAYVRVYFLRPIRIPSELKMYVKGNFTIDVVFGKDAPCAQRNVIRVLNDAIKLAAEFIELFQ